MPKIITTAATETNMKIIDFGFDESHESDLQSCELPFMLKIPKYGKLLVMKILNCELRVLVVRVNRKYLSWSEPSFDFLSKTGGTDPVK